MLADTRRPSALGARLAGARANPAPALIATISGVINGATMVLGAAAIGWSGDHLVIPALARRQVPASAWRISALFIVGISAARWSSIFVRGVATGQVQVGRTGSGKSTFAKLLTRRIEAMSGLIMLGGVRLDQIDDASMTGRVVIVPQDPFLFDATLGQNIAVGCADATDHDVLQILGELGLSEWFATLSDGLRTPVGLNGQRLSIGERQLIALARTALVAQPGFYADLVEAWNANPRLSYATGGHT